MEIRKTDSSLVGRTKSLVARTLLNGPICYRTPSECNDRPEWTLVGPWIQHPNRWERNWKTQIWNCDERSEMVQQCSNSNTEVVRGWQHWDSCTGRGAAQCRDCIMATGRDNVSSWKPGSSSPPRASDGPVTREDCVFLISITRWCQMKVLVRAYLHSGHIKYSCMDLLSHNKGYCWTCPSALLGSGTDNKPGLGC